MPNLSEILIYNGSIPLSLVIWSLYIGIVIAVIAAFFIKVKFGAFVNALLRLGANSPENAVTLEETGLKNNIFVRMGLLSRGNYKNLLVAVTDEGKYYANEHLTLIPPLFKTFVYIRRKRKQSAIKQEEQGSESTESVEESALSRRIRLENEKAAQNLSEEELRDEEAAEQLENYNKMLETAPKERIKFDVKTAKYYIPKQLHDRAASLFISKPTLFVQVLLGIVALAIVALSAEPIINLLMDFLGDLTN